MAERRIRWLRIIIVILALLTLMYLMRPETTGMVVQVNTNDTVNAAGVNATANETTTDTEPPDPYLNITRPGHYNFSVIFDYKIMFMGYDINESLLYPNDTFEVTYYWKALDDMDKDYKAFVHFTDENERILFQQDHLPPIQTSKWSQGDIVKGNYTIKIPENTNGTIKLGLGWWYPKTGGRLKIENIAHKYNKVIIGEIKVRG